MTSTTPHAQGHPLRRGNASDPASPFNIRLIASDPREAASSGSALSRRRHLHEQESLVMHHFTSETTAGNLSTNRGSIKCDEQNRTAGGYGWEPPSWPFNPDDVSPLRWWRTMPADHLGDAQHLLLRATLQNISAIKGREWLAGLRDDAAVCVAVALGALPIAAITFEVDLAMSALTVSALSGNAGSVLVLSHILRLVPLDHPFAKELSVSWLVLNLRRALETKATNEGHKFKTRHRRATRDAIDHRAAFYAGDFA